MLPSSRRILASSPGISRPFLGMKAVVEPESGSGQKRVENGLRSQTSPKGYIAVSDQSPVNWLRRKKSGAWRKGPESAAGFFQALSYGFDVSSARWRCPLRKGTSPACPETQGNQSNWRWETVLMGREHTEPFLQRQLPLPGRFLLPPLFCFVVWGYCMLNLKS